MVVVYEGTVFPSLNWSIQYSCYIYIYGLKVQGCTSSMIIIYTHTHILGARALILNGNGLRTLVSADQLAWYT